MRIVGRSQKQLDAGNFTAGVFIDFKKVFQEFHMSVARHFQI